MCVCEVGILVVPPRDWIRLDETCLCSLSRIILLLYMNVTKGGNNRSRFQESRTSEEATRRGVDQKEWKIACICEYDVDMMYPQWMYHLMDHEIMDFGSETPFWSSVCDVMLWVLCLDLG
jgi:hypothetical protein